MTVAPYHVASSTAILDSMDSPVRIGDSTYDAYSFLGYTVQRSDQPGYEDRWFVFRERRPFRAWLRNPDGGLHTFGSLEEAAAWLSQNPDALPKLPEGRP